MKLKRLLLRESSRSDGFSLFELLVVMIIIGTLSAIIWAVQIGIIDKAKYANDKLLIATITLELKDYRITNNKYPSDVPPNTRPDSSITAFPVIPGNIKTGFNSRFDYDSFRVDDQCWVQIVDYGKDDTKHYDHTIIQGRLGEFIFVNTNMIYLIYRGKCSE